MRERRRAARNRGLYAALALLATGAALAACSSTPDNAALSTTTSDARTTTTAPVTTTTGAAVATTSSTIPTVAMQTPSGGEFLSPSKNISCEIDDTPAGQVTLCLTISPPRSVRMTADGTLTECSGVQCLSNAGLNTPTLAYGTATGVGPFRCVSQTSGITCTVTSGKGFEINTAGITPVG